MKTRTPLRQLLFAPLVAIAMISGALTPLATAQADPLDPDNDVVEVTPSPSAGADVLQDEEITTETPEPGVSDPETPDGGATTDEAPGAEVGADEAADDVAEEVTEAIENDYALSARASTSAAVPLTAEASAVVEARSLSTLRLRKSNGAWVNITPQMQANALVVIDTVRSAQWSGVTSTEKDRLIVIALMVMAQESTFYTHPYAHIPDRNQDVGPFQQRSKVGWYADGKTQAENIKILNNIPYATKTFIEGHRVPKRVSGGAGPTGYIIPGVFQMKNWRTDSMWRVAANVQRPASRYRYHYEYWRPVVQEMVKALNGYTSDTGSPEDVYTVAGDHRVNGRHWRTTCEAYSNAIDRCTAKIWGTQVTRKGSRYVQKDAWYFNNLTYRPSARTQWKENPLGYEGKFTSAGRQWKTECDRGWVGPDSCRSYVMSHVIESSLDKGGNRKFRQTKKWVFNNIVQFK